MEFLSDPPCKNCSNPICIDGGVCNYEEQYIGVFGIDSHYARIPRRYQEFITKHDSILLIPCNDGRDIQTLRRRGYNVWGMEYSKQALSLVPEKIKEFAVWGDIREIPAEDNSFDVVMCRYLLEHFEDPTEAFNEMYRVAKRYIYIGVTAFDDKRYPTDPTHCCKMSYREWGKYFDDFEGLRIRKRRKQGGGEWLLEVMKNPPIHFKPDTRISSFTLRMNKKKLNNVEYCEALLLNIKSLLGGETVKWSSFSYKPGIATFLIMKDGFLSLRTFPEGKAQLDIRTAANHSRDDIKGVINKSLKEGRKNGSKNR